MGNEWNEEMLENWKKVNIELEIDLQTFATQQNGRGGFYPQDCFVVKIIKMQKK